MQWLKPVARQPLLLFCVGVGVLLGFAGYRLGPFVGTQFLKKDYSDDLVMIATALRPLPNAANPAICSFGGCDPLDVSIVIPRTTKLPGTFRVRASLPSELRPFVERNSTKATLLGPGFDISPSGDVIADLEAASDFTWLLTPKTTGHHDLAFNVTLVVRDRTPFIGPRSMAISKDISIEVLSSLGLTSSEDSICRALGSVIGCLGSFLGYPLWKRFFEKKTGDRGKPEESLIIRP